MNWAAHNQQLAKQDATNVQQAADKGDWDSAEYDMDQSLVYQASSIDHITPTPDIATVPAEAN
jgi:hypothetical protein